MNPILDFVTNPFIVTGISSWMLAQIIKFIIYFVINKKCNLKQLFSAGGMPSGHCATVCSVAFLAALRYGTGSFQFAICLILSFVVCHDAMGVRRETGKQAVSIIKIAEMLNEYFGEKDQEIKTDKLKVLVGHTPFQVICGALVGAVVVILYVLIFGGIIGIPI